MRQPSEKRSRRKKRGRPSLRELQKRTLRSEKQQPEASPDGGSEDEEDGCDDKGRRKERKLKLVMRLQDGISEGVGRRGRGRRRRLDDVGDDRSAAASGGGDAKAAAGGSKGPSTSGLKSRAITIPDKKLLVSILDKLQRKDKFSVFARPVDSEELPDYHEIIKCPMDFSTIRMKLDKGSYRSLEQFADDVFLISSNAMSYNPPSSVYYRQARAIQELAKKEFQNLRQQSHGGELDPKLERKLQTKVELEPEQKPRRGRPPSKKSAKPKIARPPDDHVIADLSSGSTLTNAASDGRLPSLGLNMFHRTPVKCCVADASKVSNGFRISEGSMLKEHNPDKIEEHSGMMSFATNRCKKLFNMDEIRPATCSQAQLSTGIHRRTVTATSDGERRLLVPVGLQVQHSYALSLARFAANLGPVAWEIAAKRIERSLPLGTDFGRGWVAEKEAPVHPQPPPQSASHSNSTNHRISVTNSECAPDSVCEVPSRSFVSESGTDTHVQTSSSAAIANSSCGTMEWGAAQFQSDPGRPMKADEHLLMNLPINGFVLRTEPGLTFSEGTGSVTMMMKSLHCISGNQLDAGKANSIANNHNDQVSQHENTEQFMNTSALFVPSELNAGYQSPAMPASAVKVDLPCPDLVLQL